MSILSIGFTPSPGTPGEGRGEGSVAPTSGAATYKNPHPSPLPACRERGPESALPLDLHRRFERDPLDRLGLGHARPAVLTRAAARVGPEVLHRLAEVDDD